MAISGQMDGFDNSRSSDSMAIGGWKKSAFSAPTNDGGSWLSSDPSIVFAGWDGWPGSGDIDARALLGAELGVRWFLYPTPPSYSSARWIDGDTVFALAGGRLYERAASRRPARKRE